VANYFEQLLQKYREKGLILDTNLMLLLAVGAYNQQRIVSFKRTQRYAISDYHLVVGLLSSVRRRVTTPNILTEVDNMVRQLPKHEHVHVAAAILAIVQSSFEVYVPSIELMATEEYAKLGLTDSVLLQGAKECLVITDDFPLAQRLQSIGRDVININHLRQL
jgi:hypothetical protein